MRPSAPHGCGTDGRREDAFQLRLRAASWLHHVDLPELNRAAEQEVWAIAQPFDGLIVALRLDCEVTAEDLFRLAVRAIRHTQLAVVAADDAARLVGELVTRGQVSGLPELLPPGHVLFDGRLHLLGAESCESAWILM